VAQNAAIAFGYPCIVFSLEMGAAQLVERMLCSEARIDSSLLRRGQGLQRQDMINLTVAADAISKAPILIDDTPAMTVNEVRSRCRRWRANSELFKGKPMGLIVVDYLQLMKGSASNKNANREQEISEISRGLKALAKDVKCPVLALSQLNRAVDSRTDKRPLMSDLRESGAIEQDADVISFIYRDEVYNKETEEKGVAEVIIAKQRNGPIGTAKLRFEGRYTRFDNLEQRRDEY
jgi:replicative DNA helicase